MNFNAHKHFYAQCAAGARTESVKVFNRSGDRLAHTLGSACICLDHLQTCNKDSCSKTLSLS